MQTTTAKDEEARALLRHELATMPLPALRKGYRDAVWRFAMAGSDNARSAHATAEVFRTGGEVR